MPNLLLVKKITLLLLVIVLFFSVGYKIFLVNAQSSNKGDYDNSGCVDSNDLNSLLNIYKTTTAADIAKYDLNADSKTDAIDLSIIIYLQGTCYTGTPTLTTTVNPSTTTPIITTTSKPGAIWKPAQNTTWQWMIDGGRKINENVDVQMYDIDMQDAVPYDITINVPGFGSVTWKKGVNAGAIDRLHAKGKKVICYTDTGAFETYRSDANLFPGKLPDGTRPFPYTGPASLANIDIIGNGSEAYNGQAWDGEYWLDLRKESWQYFAPIIWGRLDLAKQMGCDGVEGDQNNTYGNNPGFPSGEAISLEWYKEVYYQTHIRGLTVISKNGIEITAGQVAPVANDPQNLKVPDGILNEECYYYGECASLKPALDAGMWVGEAEYDKSKVYNNAATWCADANKSKRMAMFKNLILDNYLYTCWTGTQLSASLDPKLDVALSKNIYD